MTYFGPLMRFTGMYVSSPAEAEEIVSDTFLAIWNNRKQLPGISNFDSYIYTVARHKAISYYRKQHMEQVSLDEPDGPVLYVRGADMVSGTPIVDIKPYLAYADSYPDAAGGFTGGDAGAVLTVDFPPELLAQFDSGQRHGLLSALAADPRPRYQDDPDRVYGMAYAGKNVRFTVQDGTVRVVGVE